MEWAMLYLFIALKIPLLGACWIVWWAIHQKPEEDEPQRGDGGQRTRPHPPRPLPRSPRRRGPHGDPAPLPPPRVRIVRARGTRLPR